MDISFLKGMGTHLKIVSVSVTIFGQVLKKEISKSPSFPFGSKISIRKPLEAVAKTPNTLFIIAKLIQIEGFQSGD